MCGNVSRAVAIGIRRIGIESYQVLRLMSVDIDQVLIVSRWMLIFQDLLRNFMFRATTSSLTQDDGDRVVLGASVAQLTELLLDLGQLQVARLPAELLYLLDNDIFLVVETEFIIEHRLHLLLRLIEGTSTALHHRLHYYR